MKIIRYFWGNFLEKREASTLKKSDVVAVVAIAAIPQRQMNIQYAITMN